MVCRMKPPEPDMFISGCVRPGKTWYLRSHISVTAGPRYCGSSRNWFCRSVTIWDAKVSQWVVLGRDQLTWTCGLCTTMFADPARYGVSFCSIEKGSNWLATTRLTTRHKHRRRFIKLW